jgi:hypothetical protein
MLGLPWVGKTIEMEKCMGVGCLKFAYYLVGGQFFVHI